MFNAKHSEEMKQLIIFLILFLGTGILAEVTVHETSEKGDVKATKDLITKGAEINSKDNQGLTPLHIAVRRGHLELVKFLLSANADINLKDNRGWTPLHAIFETGNLEIVKLLLAKKADPNAKNTFDYTPVHFAAQDGNLEMRGSGNIKIFINSKTSSGKRKYWGKNRKRLDSASYSCGKRKCRNNQIPNFEKSRLECNGS